MTWEKIEPGSLILSVARRHSVFNTNYINCYAKFKF